MFSPNETTIGACMQAIFGSTDLHLLRRVCREATPDVAPARECPPVPERVPAMYPRRSNVRQGRQQYIPFCRDFLRKPSDGLEPSTPSLPWARLGNWSQPTATVLACFCPVRACGICHGLPPVATTGL